MQPEIEARLKLALEILANEVDVLEQEELDDVMENMNLPYQIVMNPSHR